MCEERAQVLGSVLVAAFAVGIRPRAALSIATREQALAEAEELDGMRAKAKANLLDAIQEFNAAKARELWDFDSVVPKTLSVQSLAIKNDIVIHF